LKGRRSWNKGIPATQERISKMVASRTGLKMKPHSEATKEKMRLAKFGYIPWNAGKPMPKYKCSHCDKECSLLNLKKWHNENCKSLLV